MAANELGVTQAAVSRSIAQLESDFDRPLFRRGSRKMEPTPACLTLGSALAGSFQDIVDAVDAMRAETNDMVTIGATIAVSSMWLLPRITEFHRVHPAVQIRVISQDTKLSLETGEADIAVRYGVPPFDDGNVIASKSDTMFPVCSPEYAMSHDVDSFPHGQFDLLETDMANRGWQRWSDWFVEAGFRADILKPTMRFSFFNDTIAAALAGQGVALGWNALIERSLENGRLVKVSNMEIESKGSYNIVVPFKPRNLSSVRLIESWITENLR